MVDIPAWAEYFSELMEWAYGHIPDPSQRRAFGDWLAACPEVSREDKYCRALALLPRGGGRYEFRDKVLERLPDPLSSVGREMANGFNALTNVLEKCRGHVRAIRMVQRARETT